MKFSGIVGFYVGDIETSPGVYKHQIVERKKTGDILQNLRRFQETEYQNDTLKVNNRISIVSDLYFQQNWSSIRYVIWNGAKLKVTNIDIGNYPRLTLEIGGKYDGENEITTSS